MAKINKMDEAFREEALFGKILPLILKVCIPLAIFQGISQLFSIIDTLMASHISASAVSTVVYLVQFNHFIAAIGIGLSVGGSITIAHAYGAGDYDKVKKALSTVFFLSSSIGLVVLLLLPFSPVILRITGTPEEFIQEGSRYFSITMASQIIGFINTLYIAIERTRGKSKRILALNLITVCTKLSLTAVFVYILNGTIIHIALASLVSNLIIFIIAIKTLVANDDAFSFSYKQITLKKEFLAPILKLSFPSMIEKMAFSYGKGLVNKMAASYGTNAVGAAGISNNMSGLLTNLQMGFSDGGTSLLGQVYGSNKTDRTIKIYRRIQLIELMTGLIGFVFFYSISPWIARLFSITRGGYDPEFHNMILTIYHYELFGTLLLSFNYASLTILLGIGKTRLTLMINFARIFIFRLPVIWAFQRFSSLGYEAVGYTMAISNSLTGVFGFIVAEIVIYKEKKKIHNA